MALTSERSEAREIFYPSPSHTPEISPYRFSLDVVDESRGAVPQPLEQLLSASRVAG
jgi:hypothetical protein